MNYLLIFLVLLTYNVLLYIFLERSKSRHLGLDF
nr:MAG TPA_asm: hypothetical protein [Caudoviricetes sp.]